MPTPELSDAECQSAVNAVARYGSKTQAAQQTGINRLTLYHRLRVAASRGIRATQFAVKAPISETLPVEAIRERRRLEKLERKKRRDEAIGRDKLELDPVQPKHFITETGVGYRLVVEQ